MLSDDLLEVVALASDTQVEMINSDIYYLYNHHAKSHTHLSYSAYQIINQIDGKKSIKEITDVLTNHNSTMEDYLNVKNFVFEELKKYGFLHGYKKENSESSVKFSRIIIGSGQVDWICRFIVPIYKIKSLIGFITISIFLFLFSFIFNKKFLFFDNNTTDILLLVISTAFLLISHEFGHCTALKKFGQPSDGVGIGLYFFTPVLFADVSRAWILNSKQRLIVDLGGFYFQMIVTAIYFILVCYTNNYTLMCVVLFSLYLVFFNMNPFIKSDLYWGISDYFKIVNLHEQADKTLVTFFIKNRNTKLNYLLLLFGILRYLFIGVVMYLIIYLFIELIKTIISGEYLVSLFNIEKDLLVIISFLYFLFELRNIVILLIKYFKKTGKKSI